MCHLWREIDICHNVDVDVHVRNVFLLEQWSIEKQECTNLTLTACFISARSLAKRESLDISQIEWNSCVHDFSHNCELFTQTMKKTKQNMLFILKKTFV